MLRSNIGKCVHLASSTRPCEVLQQDCSAFPPFPTSTHLTWLHQQPPPVAQVMVSVPLQLSRAGHQGRVAERLAGGRQVIQARKLQRLGVS